MEYPHKDVIVGEQWLVLSKIGEGSFGEVFKAQDIASKGFYAVKRESLDLEHPQLHHESIVYDVLAGGPCIPQCHWYGQHDGFDCIVIDLLGSSLKHLQQTVRDIPLDIVIDLGCQLISCLEHIHDRGLVYRDIKPENFLFSASCVLPPSVEEDEWTYNNLYHSPPPSPPSCKTVFYNQPTNLYAVDFGLATWWRNPKTKKPYSECKKPIKYKTGTARYASLNVHRGRTHARRDDMESLGYLLLDLLLSGELPWSGVTARTSKAGWDRLKAIKEEILLEDMCLGLPHGIMDYIDYTRRLRFGDRPDYDYLRRLLRGCNEAGPFSKLVTPHPHTRMIPSPPRYHHYSSHSNNSHYSNSHGYGHSNTHGYNHSYSHSYQQPSSRKRENSFDLKRRSSTNMHKMKPATMPLPPSSSFFDHHQQQQQQHHEDVFVMDDLVKELPSVNNSATRKSSSYNNNRNYHRYHSSSNSSQHRHYHYNKRNNNNRHVGWNTHKNYATNNSNQPQWELSTNKSSLQTP